MALVGYMGSGKSGVGRELASRLGWRRLDTDEEVERLAGATIPEVFASHGDSRGEERFRELEHEALAGALRDAGRRGVVVSCGGGIVTRPENRALLSNIPTVFLEEDLDVLYQRTRGEWRPLRGAGPEDFARRYHEREEYYRAVAGLVVECGGRSRYEISREVALWLDG